MWTKLILVLPVCIFLLAGCAQKREISIPLEHNPVVLINSAQLDRCDLANLINNLSNAQVSVIGINLLFVDDKDAHCDSLLIANIRLAGNVILTESFKDEHSIPSNEKFTKFALLSTPLGIMRKRYGLGLVCCYSELIQDNSSERLTFPAGLALNYKPGRIAMETLSNNAKEWHWRNIENFTTLKVEQIKQYSGKLKDSVVIIGYLGPEDIDMKVTENEQGVIQGQYASVVYANAVLDILERHN